jgi:CheY-like chemotaxis protein/anti-sigma regulatory factor (Ser/Thr protein kinase)
MHIPLTRAPQAGANDSGPSGAATASPPADAQASDEQALQREFDLFVGRVSHELQSVLQNTEGFASALLASAAGKLDAKEQHFVERIRQNLLRGNRLLHDMVGYYRLATCPIEPASVATRRAVDLAIARVQAQQRLTVDWRCSGEWPAVRADAGLLEHALVELLGNAVKFSGPSTPVVVELASTALDGYWELRITDHGVGFDAADLPRLFQPCSRLHGPPLAGSGMGLATVRRIAQRLGGRVDASPVAHGAVFTLALPLAPAVSGTASPAPPQRRRVLLIDDDPLVLSSLSAMLQQAGCEVTPADGGAAALVAFEQALASAPFDVVVTDLGLPGLRGDELARRVKQRAPATSVLVMTGQAPESVRRDLPEADGVIGKPLRIAALRAALAQLPARAA